MRIQYIPGKIIFSRKFKKSGKLSTLLVINTLSNSLFRYLFSGTLRICVTWLYLVYIHNSLKVLSKVFLLQLQKIWRNSFVKLKFPLYYYYTAQEKVIGKKPTKIILLEFTYSKLYYFIGKQPYLTIYH